MQILSGQYSQEVWKHSDHKEKVIDKIFHTGNIRLESKSIQTVDSYAKSVQNWFRSGWDSFVSQVADCSVFYIRKSGNPEMLGQF